MPQLDKQKIYDYLATIPKGKVVTYGQIAEHLGDRNLARAVGNALHQNPDGNKYPCYKVVNSSGALSANYAFGGLSAQQERLEADGISVENGQVDLQLFQWHPEEAAPITTPPPRRNFRCLSGSVLKLLAVLCMLIDHSASILVWVIPALAAPFTVFGKAITLYWIMRKIGRLAFPIFCFLIAEGYRHTRDKKKYALRLLLFALISEIPFDLMYHSFFDLSLQNVYFTLFFGLILIRISEYNFDQLKKFLVMAAVCLLTYFFGADYGLQGALLVLVIYILRNHAAAQALIAYPLLSGGLAAEAAFIPINLYNGQRGFIKGPVLKFLFYAFYPLHILILVGIRYLLST